MLQATAEKQSDPDSMSELLAASEMAIQLRLVHSLETAKEAPNKLRKLCDKSNAKIR